MRAKPGSPRSRRSAARVLAIVRDRFEHGLLRALADRLLELNPIERSLALGSKLFTAVVPLAILLSGLLASPDAVAKRMIDGFGLTGAGAEAMRELFRVPSGEAGAAISVIGVLVLLYSLLSFARALQRAFEDAWHLPPLGARGLPWTALWIVSLAVYFSLSAPLSRVLYDHGLHLSAFVASLVCGAALWLLTPMILLGRRVSAAALAPGSVVTAALLILFNVGSHLYLPRSATTNVERYGLVGVTFTVLTWLFAFSLTLIASAASGAVLSERYGRWRSSARDETWGGAGGEA